TLREPVLHQHRALRVAARREHLRVHHDLDPGLLGDQTEDHARLHHLGPERASDEVSGANATERRRHGMNVEQVAIDDFSAEILQELRPVVFAMRQHPDRVALFEELPGGSATGVAGRPGDENHGFRHRSPSFEARSYFVIALLSVGYRAPKNSRERISAEGPDRWTRPSGWLHDSRSIGLISGPWHTGCWVRLRRLTTQCRTPGCGSAEQV